MKQGATVKIRRSFIIVYFIFRLKMLHGTSIMQTQRHRPFSLSMTERSSEYLRALSEAKLKKQTQQNYLKSLKMLGVGTGTCFKTLYFL